MWHIILYLQCLVCFLLFYFFQINDGLNHYSSEELKTSITDRRETEEMKSWRDVIHSHVVPETGHSTVSSFVDHILVK